MDKSMQAVSVYNQTANIYDNEYKNTSTYIDDFLDMVKKNGKILDVGCGSGNDSNYIASRGFGVIGVDLSEGMIRIAKKNFPGIDFGVMDMRELEFEPGSFDGIFVAFSLIHLSKKEALDTLKRLYNLLKGRGVIYIAVQEGESKEQFIVAPWKRDKKIFLNVFSSKEIESLIRETGFSIITEHVREPRENEFRFNKLFIIARK